MHAVIFIIKQCDVAVKIWFLHIEIPLSSPKGAGLIRNAAPIDFRYSSKFCVLSFHQLCIHGMDELISIIMQRFPEYPFQVGNRMDFAR